MSNISHTHYEKYITRIIHRGGCDWIQFICEEDGIIFKEIRIVDGATNG